MSEDPWAQFNPVPVEPSSDENDPWARFSPTPIEGAAQPGEEKTILANPLVRFGIGAAAPLVGAGQTLAHSGMGGPSSVLGVNPLLQGGMAAGRYLGVPELADTAAQKFSDWAKAGRKQAGLGEEAKLFSPSTWDVPATIGEAVSPANLGPARAIGALGRAAGGLGAGLGRGAAYGGAYEAAKPLTEEERAGRPFEEVKGERIGLAGAAGAVMAPPLEAAARVVGPRLSEGVNYLLDRGVRLTPGQTLEGWWNRAENLLRSTPVSGEMVRESQKRAMPDFNRAAYDEALSDIGEILPRNVAPNYDAMGHLKRTVSREYDDAHANISASLYPNRPGFPSVYGVPAGARNSGQDFINEIHQIFQQASGELDRPALQHLQDIVGTNVLKRFYDNNGVLLGHQVQASLSRLKDIIRNQQREGGNSTLAMYLNDVRSAFETLVEQQNPRYAQQLRNANRSYAKLKILEDATSGAAPMEFGGEITPQQLANAIVRNSNRGRRSTGEAFFQDLAQHGMKVLGQRVPESTTLERMALLGALGVGSMHGVGPAAIGGMGTVAGLYNEPVQWALRQAIAGANQPRRAAGDLMRRYGPYGTVPATINQLMKKKEEAPYAP